jgi:hypothetical protein
VSDKQHDLFPVLRAEQIGKNVEIPLVKLRGQL